MDPKNDPKPKFDELPEAPVDDANANPWQSSKDKEQATEAPAPKPASEPSQPETAVKPKRTFKQKLVALLKSRRFWLIVVALLVVALATVWFVQPSRWWLVNTLGARNTLSITTASPGEGQAKQAQLKNVEVTVNGQKYKTDDKGKLSIGNIPYGSVSISAKKNGFQSVNYGVTLDFDPFFHWFGGSETDNAARNIELSMKSTGIPVSFKVVDWLSGKPVTVGEFTIGDVVAKPDKNGLVTLRVPGTDDSKVTVSATFGGAYLDKKFDAAIGSTNADVAVVPGGKDYFISKRSGVLSLYSSNLDGSDVQTIVAGTGKENNSMSFAVSPDGKYGVLSSARDGAKNARQDLMQRVYVVDLASKQLTRVDEGVRVQYADWSGNVLVYTTDNYTGTGYNYNTTLRSVDVSNKRVYNFESGDNGLSVATVSADKVVYFRYSPDANSPLLKQAYVTASGIRTLGEKVSRSDYMQRDFDRIVFKTEQDQAWHEYNFNTNILSTVAQQAGSTTIRYFNTSNGNKRLFVDYIDGKFTLFMKDGDTGTQTALYSKSGLGGPIRWVGDSIIFRVNDDGTADYVISTNGGQPRKITDVTNVSGTQGSQGFMFY